MFVNYVMVFLESRNVYISCVPKYIMFTHILTSSNKQLSSHLIRHVYLAGLNSLYYQPGAHLLETFKDLKTCYIFCINTSKMLNCLSVMSKLHIAYISSMKNDFTQMFDLDAQKLILLETKIC